MPQWSGRRSASWEVELLCSREPLPRSGGPVPGWEGVALPLLALLGAVLTQRRSDPEAGGAGKLPSSLEPTLWLPLAPGFSSLRR